MHETTAGGIMLTTNTKDDLQYSIGRGTVIAIGPDAFKAYKGDGNWFEVGDEILFQSFSGNEGQFADEEDPDAVYRFINDDTVFAKRKK